VGDEVKEEQLLLQMDKNDLLLEEAELLAEKNRYSRETEKARASNELADMRIAEAIYQQTLARLELVRYRLQQVEIKAPFTGIIVEGNQIERIGFPVSQGDILFKIARLDSCFAELEVPESEVHHVKVSREGEIALASKPQETYPLVISRLEPAAVVKESGNAFIAHCEFPEEIPPWWRPGMTGLAKLEAGQKSLLWIFTHRTMDFLRLKLWW
jgi:multidrug resistance efflux pump